MINMDIDEIRRINIKALWEKQRSALIDACKMQPAQFYNLRDGAPDSKTGKPRGMRKETAWKIEDAAGVPRGYLDKLHATPPEENIEEAIALTTAKRNDVTIPQFDAIGSMGNGLILRDQPGVIESWKVSPEWVSKNVKAHSGIKNLVIVTGFGDSMKPKFNSGDPIIVDIGVTSVDFDAIYFFRVGEEGFIKILQRIPGDGIRAISENKAYEAWTIKPDMDFEVLGLVLKAWKSEDF